MIETWCAHLTALSLRQWGRIGAVLLCVVSGVYLLQSDVGESVVITQNTETASSSMEITGLSSAAAKMPLRNPFSSAHERVGEIPEEAGRKETEAYTAATRPSPAPTVAPTSSTPPTVTAVPPAPSLPVLRGVVQSADGSRMVILAEGTEAAALGIGDTWHGYTLHSATERTATIEAASGTITLTRE